MTLPPDEFDAAGNVQVNEAERTAPIPQAADDPMRVATHEVNWSVYAVLGVLIVITLAVLVWRSPRLHPKTGGTVSTVISAVYHADPVHAGT